VPPLHRPVVAPGERLPGRAMGARDDCECGDVLEVPGHDAGGASGVGGVQVVQGAAQGDRYQAVLQPEAAHLGVGARI
jgi:hypothetical protein